MALSDDKYTVLRKREKECQNTKVLTAFYAQLRVELSPEDYDDYLQRSLLAEAVTPGIIVGIKRS